MSRQEAGFDTMVSALINGDAPKGRSNYLRLNGFQIVEFAETGAAN
jgi:hypothetical protein